MQKQKKGKIINIPSNVARRNPNYIHYVTSNRALIAMTRAMRASWASEYLRANTVSPGFVVTKAVRSMRNTKNSAPTAQHQAFPSRNDLVGTVLSCRRRKRLMTGQLLNVDGGFIRRMRILFWLISPQQ